MKKLIAITLSVMMVVTMLAACGNTDDAADSAETTAASADEAASVEETSSEINYDSELVVGVSSDIGSMDQLGAGTSGAIIKKILVYESLFYLDENQELLPLLAKSYTDLGDGTYEVELFDYIYDSEGNHITASDVAFSFEQFIGSSGNTTTWKTITDYEATGDYTFQFTMDPEMVGQLENILSRVSIISQQSYEDSGDELATYPIGTGGYVLDTENSVSGSIYVFTRRDDYWQTDEEYICDRNANYLKTLTVRIYTEAATLANALEIGEIDFSSDIEATYWSMFLDDDGEALDGYTTISGENNAFVHLTFNCSDDSPFHDINLRKAMCYAIDAAALAYQVYGARGEVCYNATNPNLFDTIADDGSDYFGYDVEYAQELVDASDYDGETIVMLVLPKYTVNSCAVLIQSYCAAVGINIELLEYDYATYRTVRQETENVEYDVELLGATSAVQYVYTASEDMGADYSSGLSRILIEDETLDELYTLISEAETDTEENVQAFLDYVEEQCYSYGLYYADKIFIGNSDKITDCVSLPFYGPLYNSIIVND